MGLKHWDKVHLNNVPNTLTEVTLCLNLFSKRRDKKLVIDTELMMKYSQSRNAIFQAFYQFTRENEKNKEAINSMRSRINKHISKNYNKFNHMTTIEKLANIALRIRQKNENFNQESELFRLALECFQEGLKYKSSKEDIIQAIAGHLRHKERLNYMGKDKTLACEEFAMVLYEDLFEKEWKGNFPSRNRERSILYQFAFVYSKKVDNYFIQKKNSSSLETV